MQYTNLAYSTKEGWKIGMILLMTDKFREITTQTAKDALAWMSAQPNTSNNLKADDLLADLEDMITRILYDDDGQLVALMPANRYDDTGREKIVIDSPEKLAAAMNIHMTDRHKSELFSKTLYDKFMESLRKANLSKL